MPDRAYTELASQLPLIAAAIGTITDPLQQQPFGYYGALNDRFGVRWMFHTERK